MRSYVAERSRGLSGTAPDEKLDRRKLAVRISEVLRSCKMNFLTAKTTNLSTSSYDTGETEIKKLTAVV